MLKAVRTFRDAAGLYYADRYKPIFEVVINLVASILLANKIGLSGIFWGTIISTITTCFWIEPWILYKIRFESNLFPYFIKWFMYLFSTIGVGIITLFLCNCIEISGILGFIIQMMICAVIPNILFLVLFCRTKEMKFFIRMIQKGKK